jgi:hypothetical protein
MQAIGDIAFVLIPSVRQPRSTSVLSDFFDQEGTRVSYQNALVVEE